ncbi:hypothetical protein [Leisingera sp. MMG026]|uniref:hypothetical protein n=1 Tax=Leisingera sp. MMG026 TaxID=2909982 RepID=UPI001F3A32E6|nr:hypothetical protein [Leisingera sp. MMG026]MCF6433220.1 hypothetical protein [Leisingera sp. MMG026]
MDGQTPVRAAALAVAGTSIIPATGHVIYAVAFSTSSVVAIYTKTGRWIEGILGVYFCFASYNPYLPGFTPMAGEGSFRLLPLIG